MRCYQVSQRSVIGMVIHTSERVTMRRCRAILRPAITVLCVFAFLGVGFAHSIHHFETTDSTATLQSGKEPSDASPGSSNKVHVAAERCLGCTIIAIAPANDFDLSISLGQQPSFIKIEGMRAHAVPIELPPPRSST